MMKWKTGREHCEFSKAHITNLKMVTLRVFFILDINQHLLGDIPKNVVN
jgi:hypothetical protein